ncbi:MAG: hypothetical protein IRZ10_09625 [Thermoflavifilum sp.]|nr:hypothetical protein [Thermoflavifilum sp.]MCL6514666.1 hypothetical protein [Alicyclobacillus sp.]
MTTAEPQAFRWYCITGRLEGDGSDVATVVCFVQASSPASVIKHFGGRQKCKDLLGRSRVVLFPKRPAEVMSLPRDWTPADIRSGLVQGLHVIVQVIPAVRYVCDQCGAERMSERWYDHVWCSCGQAVRPAAPVGTETGFGWLHFPQRGPLSTLSHT